MKVIVGVVVVRVVHIVPLLFLLFFSNKILAQQENPPLGDLQEIPEDVPTINSLAFPPRRDGFQDQKGSTGYYDRDLKWHSFKNENEMQTHIQQNNISPAATYVDGALTLENREFAQNLNDDSKFYISVYVETSSDNSFKIKKSDSGEFKLQYKLGPLTLDVPEGENPTDRFSLKNAILSVNAQNSPEYFPKYTQLIQSLKSQVREERFNNRLRRETPGNGVSEQDADVFQRERFRYYQKGFAKQSSLVDSQVTYHQSNPPQTVGQCNGTANPAYQFSMTPFKKGDLDEKCKEQVDRGVASGFNSVTLFFPTHYSGGDLMSRDSGSQKLQGGWEYVFEDANAIDEQELHRCLAYINNSGLKLNFVPHLESIVTLNTRGEAEWRIMGQIPHDDHGFFNKVYTPFLNYLKDNPNSFQEGLRVSASAETDPIFLGNTNDSLNMIKRLKREIGEMNRQAEITWNPNGDFHNGWNKTSTRHLECGKISEILALVDRISPSIYEDYDHLKQCSFSKTREHWLEGFEKKMESICSSEKNILTNAVTGKKFSFGEFALGQETKCNYQNLQNEIAQYRQSSGDQGADATFWNSGSWDHAGISKASTNQALKGQIDSGLNQCRSQSQLTSVPLPNLPPSCPPRYQPTMLPTIPKHIHDFYSFLDEIDEGPLLF